MKLRTKMVWLNLIVLLIVMVILAVVMIYTSDNYNIRAVQRDLENQSEYALDIISRYLYQRGGDLEYLIVDRAYITEMVENRVECDVQIIPNSATVKEGYLAEDPDAAIKRALRLESVMGGNTLYYIEKGSPRIFYLDFPFYYNEELLAMVEFTFPMVEVDKTRQDMIIIFLVIFGITYWILIVFNSYYAYKRLKPLEDLKALVTEYGENNFVRRANINTGDEIEALALTFNKMGHDLNVYFNRVQDEQEKQKQFLDSVTHEIRTPLTNIMGYADLINKVEDRERQLECAGVIINEGDRMLNMLNSLLDMSRARSFSEDFAFERRDISLVLGSALKVMELRLDRNNFIVYTDFKPAVCYVDEEKLQRVFLNIFENALKYSGGDTIRCKTYTNVDGSRVYAEISDNGKGIPEKDLADITRPFFRLDKARSRMLGGAGLGLALCKDIIDKHSGTLEFKNVRLGGLLVRISFDPRLGAGHKERANE